MMTSESLQQQKHAHAQCKKFICAMRRNFWNVYFLTFSFSLEADEGVDHIHVLQRATVLQERWSGVRINAAKG